MATKIQIEITREQAEELADLKIKTGFLKKEDRDKEIDRILSQKLEAYVG